MNIKEQLPEQWRETIEQIDRYFSTFYYEEAADLCKRTLASTSFDPNNYIHIYFRLELAGCMLDIGGNLWDENIIRAGIEIIESYGNTIDIYFPAYNRYYNLGLGYEALFEAISVSKKIIVHQLGSEEHSELLIRAKNYYWRAYKEAPEEDKNFRLTLLINLANCLERNRRVVEALYFYDIALQIDSDFINAVYSKAYAMFTLHLLSGDATASFCHHVADYFQRSIDRVPPVLNNNAKALTQYFKQKLYERGFTEAMLAGEIKEAAAEFEQHSEYRKFCLRNSLALNEHSLYCHCSGAKFDDINFLADSFTTHSDKMLKLSVLLNRLKAEYCFARLLYYQSVYDSKLWEDYPKEVVYTDLLEDELLGSKYEAIRSSYRLCYSILDKIAFGICYLFSVVKPGESLLFENFWRTKKAVLNECSKGNLALLALYSIATDLNQKSGGEWSDFKEWRNMAEHRVLHIIPDESDTDPFGVFSDNTFNTAIGYNLFEERTLQLLHLCRAAIFYFVFCSRAEGQKEGDSVQNPESTTITLTGKIMS